MTPKDEFEHDVKLDIEARVRQGVKAVLEEVLEEEVTQQIGAGYRELTPTRRGERNGYYQRNLLTPAGKIERLVPARQHLGLAADLDPACPPWVEPAFDDRAELTVDPRCRVGRAETVSHF